MKVSDSTPTPVTSTQSVNQSTSINRSSGAFSTSDVHDLICFSHLRWNFVYQRPQHLLERATKHYRVWFIEEPMWGNELKMSTCQQADGLTVLVPHLPNGTSPEAALALQRQLIDAFIQRERISDFVAWYYTPMAMLFTDHLKPRLTIYDCMDELSAFWGAPPQLLEQEKKLMQRADLVFTGGYSLYEAKQNRHSHVFAFPSSIDFAHFSAARNPQPDPADQRGVGSKRIGFSGVIDERFDYTLLGEVAKRRPEWQFVMIGPIVKIDPALLPHGSNVHYVGMKAYKELPAYFSNWDVAILPFALNNSTKYISPTKTPEYLAAGLPVVSTPIRDVVRTYGSEDFVQIAGTADEFESAIETALNGNHPGNWPTIDAFLAENSWNRTWSEMNRLMVAQMSLEIEQ
ncbi:glycosyltransferase family 1 protein [Spirosoma utsteinense]|uniref:Glycosyltransferase involved in cell wall biosynthesis n=1 Tax=Spirosoma utsteinense TaxID=2585773 RepID=A0ABR6W020_9BACT|nr:glycosyltransferase family 1 protein [Spirosoma utsteinense]MBC3789946.1 glycosyltransferase involved in cell wall biosynthesis [Spirosoma utsteinense]